MKKLLVAATFLLSMQVGVLNQPKSAFAAPDGQACLPSYVEVFCGHTCLVEGCTVQDQEECAEGWRQIFCFDALNG
jgi:hypothetical protein